MGSNPTSMRRRDEISSWRSSQVASSGRRSTSSRASSLIVIRAIGITSDRDPPWTSVSAPRSEENAEGLTTNIARGLDQSTSISIRGDDLAAGAGDERLQDLQADRILDESHRAVGEQRV